MGKFWPMLGLILLAFPFLEIVASVAALNAFGFLACLLWWLGSVALGWLLLRTQGLALRGQFALLAGGRRHPASALLWMARRTIAALLLILPGVLSDAFALLLLLPWPRPRLLGTEEWNSPSFRRSQQDADADADVIDGEYRHVKESIPHRSEDRS